MTNGQESTCDDPFQVVLIDIQRAAQGDIHCVKKPLTEELKYVAISYRWGELQETSIDTGLGYLASITSFGLRDFRQLCIAMTNEPTMKSIPYIWVDAICVNQSDRDERKATIYHMSEIYELATWILAVPDLHAKHLEAMHSDVMKAISMYEHYIYHLLHGNISGLHTLDDHFLHEIGVPNDLNLKQLLTKYTNSFADSFMTPVKLNLYYNHVHTIEHISNNHKSDTAIGRDLQTLPDIQPPHQCDEMDCPLRYFHDLSKERPCKQPSGEWGRRILERRTAIHQAMIFFTNLIVDWSSRVWVISEFHISKKKNNLKFWFNQLKVPSGFPFFTFDMNDPRFITIQNTKLHEQWFFQTSGTVYFTFYQRLINQLNRQTFLEMMLKSKASKNEDRFYAIFPFFPQYKPLLQKERLDNMNSLLDVKLKLYKVMTNNFKLWLLYLSYKGTTTLTSPTFATSAINWPEPDDHEPVYFTVPTTHVTLLYQERVGHYLRVKPTNYVITRGKLLNDQTLLKTLNRLLDPKTLQRDDDWTYIDSVKIHDIKPTPIILLGSFKENTWLLGNFFYQPQDNKVVKDLADKFNGFRVF